ncbi:MAG: tetratricopeptide repeat protein [Akkermansia sp.]
MEERGPGFHVTLGQARQLYSEGKYQEALDNYRRSLTAAQVPNMEKRRRFLETSIADASVAVAQEYIKVGRYDEAVKPLEDALKATPDHALAKRTLEIARDPVRTNPPYPRNTSRTWRKSTACFAWLTAIMNWASMMRP